jgi:type II secretory pathway pseudopilin PulG
MLDYFLDQRACPTRKTSLRGVAGGFTLIEALVAITILLVGVIGPLGLAAQGIADGLFARNQIVANYLAQEGVELIINRRDSNVYAGGASNWLTGLDGCDDNSPCAIDALSADIISCGGDVECGKLRYNESSQVFTPPNSTDRFTGATFKRTFVLKSSTSGNDDERVAEVKVVWYNHLAEKQLILNDYLYNYE